MRDIERHFDAANIARVCDPATAKRTAIVYHNPNTGENWLAARVLPGEVSRFKDALAGQGCQLVAQAYEKDGEWPVLRWLRRYAPDAPLAHVRAQLEVQGATGLWG